MQPASPTCVSPSRTGQRAGLAGVAAGRSVSRGSGPRGRTRPGCALRPVPSGPSPTGGPSPCPSWDRSTRWRAPGAWSVWWQPARPASSPPPCPSGWERPFVSFSCLVEAHPYPAPTTGGRAGVDLGLRVLATVADDAGTITHVPNPAPLRATLTERRRVGRQLSRRIPGSNGLRIPRPRRHEAEHGAPGLPALAISAGASPGRR